ncbi:MAG: hypothetical protein ACR2L2_05450 [Acidobacteriota bacterium]
MPIADISKPAESRTGRALYARLALAVGLFSCALLVAEITLTRLFSVTLMYHFAFLVLSLTLFGLGAGGFFHFVSSFFTRRAALWLPLLPLVAAPLLPACLGLALRLPLSPLEWTPATIATLILIVLLCIIPFFVCGLFIALLYLSYSERISRLYAADLAGAATGCLAAVALLNVAGATTTPWVAAALLLCTAVLLPGPSRNLRWVAALCLLGLFATGASRQWLRIQYVKGRAEPPSEFEKWNAFSRITVRGDANLKTILIDADAASEIAGPAWLALRKDNLLDDLTGLVYRLRSGGQALVVGPGGGRDVAAARLAGSTVTGVEINPIIVDDIMLDRYREFSGGLYTAPQVEIVNEEARTYLERTARRFDVIQANAVDTWAATSGGAFTLSESYLYTVEAFQLYLKRLNPDGILTVGRWEFEPPQQMLRIVALALEAMRREGIPLAADKIFVAGEPLSGQADNTPAVAWIKRQPFTAGEVETLRRAAASRSYRILYDPENPPDNAFSQLIQAPDREAFFDQYPYNIRPTSDDRPFFFFTLKWRDVWKAWRTPVESRKNNAGIFLLLMIFALMLALVAAWLAPLKLARSQFVRWPTAVYFLALGLGFMMVETVLIQRSTLFLGHPTYSFATVVCALLVGAGWGSWRTREVLPEAIDPFLKKYLLVVIVSLVVLGLGLPDWLRVMAGRPLIFRVAWLAAPIFLLGSFLGRLFPLGLRRVDATTLPWAWALNGAASVLGSVIAVLIAMQAGFSAVLWTAAALYLAARLSLLRRPGVTVEEVQPERRT